MIKDIEARTGAHITVDQSGQNVGYSTAMVYGSDEAVASAKQVIQNELVRCMERDQGPGGQTIPPPHGGGGPNNPTKDALAVVATLLAVAGQAATSDGGQPQALQ